MTPQVLQAFHNSQEEKDTILKQLQQHYDQDEIIKGIYWEDGKGCAVGCLLHSSDHSLFPSKMGWPVWFGKLIDTLFERMNNESAKQFPIKITKAIPPGFSNWDSTYHKICAFMLEDVCKNIDHLTVKKAIADIIQLHKNEEKDEEKWKVARSAAWAAESVAWAVARAAVDAAAETAWAVYSAVEAAAETAWAAETVYSAARSAAWAVWAVEAAAETAWAAWSAAESARAAAYLKISEKLCELVSEK